MADKTPAADAREEEEALALEELVGAETVAAEEPAVEKTPSGGDDGAEEDLALEELMEAETSAMDEPKEKEAFAAQDPEAQEILALEELVGAETPAAEKPAAGKAPARKVAAGLGVGLSEDEKDDLEKLIKEFKQERPVSASGAALQDIQKQVKSMSKQLARISKMLLEYDSKMKSCYKIMRLYHQKSEIMNKRIDAILESIKGGKNV